MPVTINHALTATTPDATSAEIRPSHWNSAHAVTLSVSATEISGLFSNANGISFGLSNDSITASHNGLTTAAQSNHSHGNPSLNLTNLSGTTASNSAGFTLSLSAGNYLTTAAASNHSHGNPTLALTNVSGTTASASNGLTLSLSAASQSNQSLGLYAASNTTGQSSSSTFDARSVSFRGAGIASVGYSNGSVVVSVPAGGGEGDGGVGLSAGANSVSAGTVVFSNSNGVSFGLNGSTVTASHNGLTTAAASNHSHGNPTLALTNLTGTTASASNGLTVSLSGNPYGLAGFSAGTQSVSTGTLVFSNSNGVSFGMSGSSRITASHNGLTTAAASNHSHGNPTLALTNLSGTTASASNGLTLSLSAAAPGAATLTVSALGNTTVNSSGTWGNAVPMRGYGVLSVGTSNGSLLLSTPDPVDFTYLSVGVSTGGNTAGHTGAFSQRAVFVGGDNITLSGSSNGGSATFTIIGAAGGGGGGAGLSAGTQSVSTGTVVFSNSNGISFGMSGSSRITASHNGLTTAAASDHSHGNPTLALTNVSGTTASNSAGLTLSLSGNPYGLAGFSAGTQSVSTGTIVFSNSNGITFGMSGSSRITASHNGLTTAAQSNHSHGNPTLALTNITGTTASASNGLTLSLSGVAAQTNQTVGFYAVGNTTQNSSTTRDARSVSYNGLGAMTVGYSNGSVQLSAPATSLISGGAGISISTNGNTIIIMTV